MKQKADKIELISCDIDGTLLGEPRTEESDRDTLALAQAWAGLPENGRPILVYNTGRVLEDAFATIEPSPLPQPDFLIGGVGSAIHDFRQDLELDEFAEELSHGWDRERLLQVVEGGGESRRAGMERQPDAAQTSFKASWYWKNASEEKLELLEDELRAAGLDVQVVYSSHRDLDILPARGNKGGALTWLARRLGISGDRIVVAGDTGNDLRQFVLPEVRGILPGNARDELRKLVDSERTYAAEGAAAAGVLQGLRFWGLNL